MSTRDPGDVEILHLGEIRALFKEHMKCGDEYFRKNYRPLVEPLLFSKGRKKTKKSLVAREQQVLDLIYELKTKGFEGSFQRS